MASVARSGTMAPTAMLGRSSSVTRQYKDFLTPALHRRFIHAASITLAACWIEAILMSEPDFVWSWFPLGYTGVRTLILFVSCLAIFILRIANLHTGPTMTSSGLQTFAQTVTSKRALQTWFWYTLSAFLFCEVYMSSTSRDTNLGLVDVLRSYERPRLNERPVIFRALFYSLAFVQSALHLVLDFDCVRMRMHLSPVVALRTLAGPIAQQSLTLTIMAAIFGIMSYYCFFREVAWNIAYSVAGVAYSLAKSTGPTGVSDLIPLIGRYVYASLLMSTLWQVANRAFTLFASEEPLRSGQPLTAESLDPNGSLINGLVSKKEFVKYMAYTELAAIAERFEGRRRAIFADVDRTGGSAWSRIYAQCAAELDVVDSSINNILMPQQPRAAPPVQRLPKMSQPLRQENVLNASPRPDSPMRALASTAGSVAKSLGQSQGSPRAARAIEYGSEKLLGDAQALKPASLSRRANVYVVAGLESVVGRPFRLEFARQADLIVFGPHGHIDVLESAIKALCGLAVSSVKEDTMGQVQKDVADIIRLLTRTITSVEALLARLPVHWTDVYVVRRAPNVEAFNRLLKDRLGRVLMEFGEYATGIGLGRTEYRAAKEAANSKQEMKAVNMA